MEEGLQCKAEEWEWAQTRSEQCEYGRGSGLWLNVPATDWIKTITLMLLPAHCVTGDSTGSPSKAVH